MIAAPEAARSEGADAPAPVVFDVKDLSVYYGSFRAVRDVTLQIRQHEITAFIGPSGCGKSTVLRCFNRMNDLIEGCRVEGTLRYHGIDLYDAEDRSGRGAQAHRHGLPEAQPVPEVDLRQHRLRAQLAGLKGNMDDIVERRCVAPRCGTR